MVNIAGHSPGPTDEELHAFQRGTRDLIGIALHSLDAAGGAVSLPQMRVLLALGDLGRCPSSRLARTLGLGASSVTRLADRLVASGHLVRGGDSHHRSVVTLELSESGRELVERVLAWRHDELARLLSLIDPVLRAQAAEALQQLHAAVGEAYADELPGPVPL
ncbi:MarR family winged helix-turn-helix transcriptional regulator [Streptacidiphilus carbonis]|uniref:MarR family winged helix-turn-helix transcriptional regulator n=1 Tax=Streptacidiphilus carbonis TaxID=105422 RepID=UPI0005A9ED7E|nr:MarR family winged helix-turn-helix transcriptional regulator [Streptacidiphilus carbonis]